MAAPPYYGNCTAPARPPSDVAIQLTDAFPGRTFSAPLGIRQAPGDADHFYVWEQGGKVHRIDATGTAQPIDVADVTNAPEGALVVGAESGLLGLAFSPGWQTNHTVYLSFNPASGTAAAGFKSFLARMYRVDRRHQLRRRARAAGAQPRSAVHQPQRRQHPLRPRRLPLLRSRRRWLGRRSGKSRAGSDAVVRQDAAPRRRRADHLRHPADQPVRHQRHGRARDLRLRPAQPVALELRQRHRRSVGRRRRPERLGRGRQGPDRRQLRLEPLRRHAHLQQRRSQQSQQRALRSARRHPAHRRVLAPRPHGRQRHHRRLRLSRHRHAVAGRQLPLRRRGLGALVARRL